jgi:hypothetical protein
VPHSTMKSHIMSTKYQTMSRTPATSSYMTRCIINIYDTGPDLNPNNDEARQDAWSPDEIVWKSYQNLFDKQLPIDINYFLRYMSKFIGDKTFYDWQLECLRLLWCRRRKYNNYLLDCATGKGKSVVAYNTIVAYL